MKSSTKLAGVHVGKGYPVRVMGVINVSPESFYARSVFNLKSQLAQAATQMQKAGADFLDVGAMSTAPYLKTQISEEEEATRIERAVKILKKQASVPISIDTTRRQPAWAGLAAGATILNDVSGFSHDPNIIPAAKKARGLILMAHPNYGVKNNISPTQNIKTIFKKILKKAQKNKISSHRIVLDPGVGFFRNQHLKWWKWDVSIIKNLNTLVRAEIPLLVGISRKSFLGEILNGTPPEKRLAGSLAATHIAIGKGAAIVRTHDVKATTDLIHVIKEME